jgi:hypothetical protein
VKKPSRKHVREYLIEADLPFFGPDTELTSIRGRPGSAGAVKKKKTTHKETLSQLARSQQKVVQLEERLGTCKAGIPTASPASARLPNTSNCAPVIGHKRQGLLLRRCGAATQLCHQPLHCRTKLDGSTVNHSTVCICVRGAESTGAAGGGASV